MKFCRSLQKVISVTRFGSIAVAILFVYYLLDRFLENLHLMADSDPLNDVLIFEFWVGKAFILLVAASFATRALVLSLLKGRRPLVSGASWLLRWGIIAVWFAVTIYYQGGTYWGLAEEHQCYDCTMAFVGINWLSTANYLLILYLFFSPIVRMSELTIAGLMFLYHKDRPGSGEDELNPGNIEPITDE
ncbi:MAG: hypothetical protein DWQ47_13385 [Acidobacteria bacterium]|nr:MAG: hypothetical protein DWQ32_00785 [Acidobacteriota bacterium]REK02929.1 MAG: hypothetical protein DWQ38_11350 [Acidobacteriota bacterium]REK13267.1 MAG: hypothetical protein DWQ43_06475 [Acidobacteriota bacterium]REK41261.1 MAG: hypothetical protein DWQ47_13385 [Acidobacteriota bacterium]